MSLQRWAAPAAALLLAAAGCGGGGDDDSGGSGGGPTVEIVQPADGDALELPFTLVVESSEELGAPESGAHHVHLYFDGDDSAYDVIESGSGEEVEIGPDAASVQGLEPGEHVLNISLRNADHSPAGAEDEVTVQIGGEGGSGEEDDGPGLDY
jgi:hypothetical protein